MSGSGKSSKAPPSLDLNITSFEDWLVDIEIWAKLPGDAGSKGGYLYLSLEGRDKDTVRSELSVDEIYDAENGVKSILACLKSIHQKDESRRQYQTFEKFISYSRSSNQTVAEYIAEFNVKYKKVSSFTGKLPDPLLAYRLLEGCNLSSEKREICNATCSKFDLETMRSQIEKVTIGSQSETSTKNNLSFKLASNIKQEPSDDLYTQSTSNAEHENDALYSFNNRGRGYNFRRGRGYNYRGYSSQRAGHSGGWQNARANRYSPHTGSSRNDLNPLDKFGRPLMCDYCYCICHLVAECPYVKKINLCEEDNNVSYQQDAVDSSEFDHQQYF